MAAKDYEFYPAAISGKVYLAKRTKSKDLMSQDRRVVAEEEILGIFEYYLINFCEKNNTDTLIVRGEDGKEIFTATLKNHETEN